MARRTLACLALMTVGASAWAVQPPASRLGRSASPPRGASSVRMELVTVYEELVVKTVPHISIVDISQDVAAVVAKSGCLEGTVTVMSKHTTCGLFMQEYEPRLVDDLRQFLLKLAPIEFPWLHNDLPFRVGPPDWPGGDEAWREFRASEPVNAHSHVIAAMLGTSESIPITKGKMVNGAYQNVLFAELDGSWKGKERKVSVQVTGSK